MSLADVKDYLARVLEGKIVSTFGYLPTYLRPNCSLCAGLRGSETGGPHRTSDVDCSDGAL